jgi:hypothetical protein
MKQHAFCKQATAKQLQQAATKPLLCPVRSGYGFAPLATSRRPLSKLRLAAADHALPLPNQQARLLNLDLPYDHYFPSTWRDSVGQTGQWPTTHKD